jgi:hypothetical protein
MMDRLLVIAGIVVVVIIVSAIAKPLLRRRHAIPHIDLADISDADGDVATVVFTSPFCHGCRQWIEALGDSELRPYAIDIGARPDAAARYRINATPRVAVVRTRDGTVLREFDHYTPRQHDLDAISRLISAA